MDLYIQSQIGPCSEYRPISGERREVSVVISPLKVHTIEDGGESDVSVASGCNLWKDCLNIGCGFSEIARKEVRAAKA